MRRGLWRLAALLLLLSGCATRFLQGPERGAIQMSETEPSYTRSAATPTPQAAAAPSPTMDMRRQAIARMDEKLAALGMADVSRMGMNWLVELRYAGEDNFVGRVLYPSSVCLLTQGTAQKLALAQQYFEERGYRLKIWDAYRPSSYQQILYDAADDKNFVADPKRGSKHSRGAAVDVTLVDGNGEELAMPTGFDAFVPQAALDDPANTGHAKANATLLKEGMMAAGFQPIRTEWWHFDDTQWENYPLTDYDLTEFELAQ